MTSDVKVRDILKKPYHRVIVPDEDMFFGEIIEFPGCFTCDRSPAECAQHLEVVAESWLLATIAQGQDVPEPITADDFGRETRKRFGLPEKAFSDARPTIFNEAIEAAAKVADRFMVPGRPKLVAEILALKLPEGK